MTNSLLKMHIRAKYLLSPLFILLFYSISGCLYAQTTLAYVPTNRQEKQGTQESVSPQSRQLRQVFNDLKNRYGVTFMYEDRIMVDKTINGVIQYNDKVEKTLEGLLKPFGLKYKRIKAGTYVITDEQTQKPAKLIFQEGINLKPIEIKAIPENSPEANSSILTLTSKGISVIAPPDIPVRGKVTSRK